MSTLAGPIAHPYYRVSSKGQDLATQQSAVERLAAARGNKLSAPYQEKRSAKTTSDRPELVRLRQDIRAGRVKVLYVYALDRLVRTGVLDMLKFVDECRTAGCAIVSVLDTWFDMESPFMEPMLAMMAFCAKIERQRINERIADARIYHEEHDLPWGRPPRLVDDKAAAVVTEYDKVQSFRNVARNLKVPLGTVVRTYERVVASVLKLVEEGQDFAAIGEELGIPAAVVGRAVERHEAKRRAAEAETPRAA